MDCHPLQDMIHAGRKLTGSKTPGPVLLMLAEGSMPRLPVSMEAASDRMSPKMLPVTMVSNDFGLRMICMAALSTYLQSVITHVPGKASLLLCNHRDMLGVPTIPCAFGQTTSGFWLCRQAATISAGHLGCPA
jgi:hypothetical protein